MHFGFIVFHGADRRGGLWKGVEVEWKAAQIPMGAGFRGCGPAKNQPGRR